MSDGVLGNLLVKIGTDSSELNKGLAQAKSGIQSFQGEVNKILGLIGFSLTAAGLINVTKKAIEFGDQLNKLSEQTGLAASQIAKIKFAAEQSETSVEAVTKSFIFLSKNMQAAQNGSAEALQLFRNFHVEFQNQDGTLRNYNDVMLEVADRIKNTQNQTVVLANGTKLLGKNFTEILPFLKQGSDGIKALYTEQQKMLDSIGMSDEKINKFAKDSDALGDEWKKLQTLFQYITVEAISPLIPKITELITKLKDTDWSAIGQTIATAFEVVAKTLKVIIDLADKAASLMAKIVPDELLPQLKSPDWDTRNPNLVKQDDLKTIMASRAKLQSQGVDLTIPSDYSGVPGVPKQPGGVMAPSTPGELTVPGQTTPAGTSVGASPANQPTGQGITQSQPFESKYGTGEGQRAPEGFSQGGGQGIAGINFGDIMAKMEELKKKWKDISGQMAELWTTTMQSITTKFGSSVADMIVDGKDFSEAMKQMWKDIAKEIIAKIVEIIAQQMILFAWQTLTGTVGSGNLVGGGKKKIFGLFRDGGVFPSARNGMVHAADGYAMTGPYGENGIPAVFHPNEIVAPFDKFMDMVKGMSGSNVTVTVNGVQDPRATAEMVMIELDRRKRSP